MLKKYGDVISGTILFIVSVLLFRSSYDIRTTIPGLLGADFMPKVVGVLLGILSISLVMTAVLRTRLARADLPEEEGSREENREQLKVLAVLCAITVYVLILNRLGFVLSTMLFLFSEMSIMASKRSFRSYLIFAVIAVFASFFVFYLFRAAFRLYLPPGIFP